MRGPARWHRLAADRTPARRGRRPGTRPLPRDAIVAVSASRARSAARRSCGIAANPTASCTSPDVSALRRPRRARSRPGPSSTSISAKPARRTRSATVSAWPSPTSRPIALALVAGETASSPRSAVDRLEAGRSRRQRAARLPVAELGLEVVPLPLGHVRHVCDEQVELARGAACRARGGPGSRGPGARRSRAPPRAHPAYMSVATTAASGSSSAIGERDRARAGAHVQDPGGPELERQLDQELRLRPRDEDAPVHLQLDVPKPLAPDDVSHRLAAEAAPHQLGVGTGRDGIDGASGEATRDALDAPVAVASITSASRRGESTPAARSASVAASRASRAVLTLRWRRIPRPPARRAAPASPPRRGHR